MPSCSASVFHTATIICAAVPLPLLAQTDSGSSKSASNVESVNISLYQPDSELQERVTIVTALSNFINEITEIVQNSYADNDQQETLDVVVAIKPNKRIRVWYVSSLDPQPKRNDLTEKIQKLRPPKVTGGPVPFAISFNIAGASRQDLRSKNFEPPVPKEWTAAVKRLSADKASVDEVINEAWGD